MDIKKKFNDSEKESLAFSEFHLEKLDKFVGHSCQKLGIMKDVLLYFEKYVNAVIFKCLMFQRDWDKMT